MGPAGRAQQAAAKAAEVAGRLRDRVRRPGGWPALNSWEATTIDWLHRFLGCSVGLLGALDGPDAAKVLECLEELERLGAESAWLLDSRGKVLESMKKEIKDDTGRV